MEKVKKLQEAMRSLERIIFELSHDDYQASTKLGYLENEICDLKFENEKLAMRVNELVEENRKLKGQCND